MTQLGLPDTLIIVNGPEDGADFSVSRSPILIGSDPACAVIIRLDSTVQGQHALAHAVAEGYRVRSTAGAPVYVDGKRAGRVRSRLLRPGGLLRVGYTDLILECSEGGLASRSKGLAVEHDLAWALRRSIAKVGSLAASAARFVVSIPRRILRLGALPLMIGAALLFYVFPGLRSFLYGFYFFIYDIILGIFETVFGPL